MSNKSELQSNNADLQAILSTINELPQAGSSSGGGGIEWRELILTSPYLAEPTKSFSFFIDDSELATATCVLIRFEYYGMRHLAFLTCQGQLTFGSKGTIKMYDYTSSITSADYYAGELSGTMNWAGAFTPEYAIISHVSGPTGTYDN